MDKITDALLTIERLCQKYGHTHHAALAAKALEALQTDIDVYWKCVVSVNWWGGSGSMFDLYLYSDTYNYDGENTHDNTMLQQALLELCRHIITDGPENERVRQLAEILSGWLKTPLF